MSPKNESAILELQIQVYTSAIQLLEQKLVCENPVHTYEIGARDYEFDEYFIEILIEVYKDFKGNGDEAMAQLMLHLLFGDENNECICQLLNQVRYKEVVVPIDVLRKVWGTSQDDRLNEALDVAHLAMFSVPAIIMDSDSLDPERYSEKQIKQSTSRTHKPFIGLLGLDNQPIDPSAFKNGLNPSRHQSKTHVQELGGAVSSYKKAGGIQNISMAYFYAKVLFAGEILAEQAGVILSPEEKQAHFVYFRDVYCATGYTLPQEREKLALLVHEIEELTELLPNYGRCQEIVENYKNMRLS